MNKSTYIIITLVAAALILGMAYLAANKAPTVSLGSSNSACTYDGTITNSSSSVDSTSKNPILAGNGSRYYAAIVNDGATGVYLNLTSATATARTGIYLAPTGGSFEITCADRYLGAITAITASGTSTLTIVEK